MTQRGEIGERHLVVIGGGITGLAAAWEATGGSTPGPHAEDQPGEASGTAPGVRVTVLESSDRFGGKVRTSALDLPGGPLTVDEGADNFLARVPDAVALCLELGLADQLTQPAIGRAAVWIDGQVRPYMARHVLGVPLTADELASTGIVSDAAVASVDRELESTLRAPDGDVSIGAYLGAHFDREVVDHVVGPLVGGVNAGDVDELSLRAVTPQLAAAAARADGTSLTATLQAQLAQAPPTGPVFQALVGGTQTLIDSLVEQLRGRGVEMRTGAAVAALRSDPVGPSDASATSGTSPDAIEVALVDGTTIAADAVIVATPASVSAELLGAISPRAAAELRSLRHVPVAFVTLAFATADIDPGAVPDDLSGVLIPRDSGLLATAISFGSNKWPQWDDGIHAILRVATGHRHDDRPSTMSDDELIDAVRSDLSTVLGIDAEPVATRVTRWSPGFAQYEVGHLDLVERVRTVLTDDAAGLRVVGADLGGLGLPACIAQGRAAARSLLS